MDSFTSVLPAIASIIVIQLVFSWLRKSSYFHLEANSYFKFAYESNIFIKWYLFSILMFFLSAGFLTYFLSRLSIDYNTYRLNKGNSVFIISPQNATFFIPAFFLALILSSNLIDLFIRLFLSRKFFNEFQVWSDRLFAINQKRLNFILQIFIIPICILSYILLFDYYAKITNNYFIINKFYSIGEVRYKMSDINKLELFFPSFKPQPGKSRYKYYIIHFNNGNVFNFNSVNNNKSIDDQTEIIEYLIHKTCLQIYINDKEQD